MTSATSDTMRADYRLFIIANRESRAPPIAGELAIGF
jgi:hypothetical protein